MRKRETPSSLSAAALSVQPLGGPTAILEIGGLRLLTDPTFDDPADYPTGRGFSLVKITGPAMTADDVGAIDVVLLSHDQHFDNLDRSGRAFLSRVGTVLTTPTGASRLGARATALAPGTFREFPSRDGRLLRVTAVPAQHGPDGTEALTGEVIGFVLTGDGLPTTYVSGDNASLAVVEAVAAQFAAVDVAVLFAGGAQIPPMGDAYLTLTSAQAAQAALILGARHVVPLHFEGWQHFSEGRAELDAAFRDAGIGDRLVMPPPGTSVALGTY